MLPINKFLLAFPKRCVATTRINLVHLQPRQIWGTVPPSPPLLAFQKASFGAKDLLGLPDADILDSANTIATAR